MTMVVPSGKPAAGASLKIGTLPFTSSIAVAVPNGTVVCNAVASVVISAGAVITGATVSVTVTF